MFLKGVKFSDLKMEMTVDEGHTGEAVLTFIPMKEILLVPEQNSVRNISRSIELRLRSKKRRQRKQMYRMGKIFNRGWIVVGIGSFIFGLNTVIIAKIRQYRRRLERRTKLTPEKIEPAEQSRAESAQAKEVKYLLTKELFFYYNRKGKKT